MASPLNLATPQQIYNGVVSFPSGKEGVRKRKKSKQVKPQKMFNIMVGREDLEMNQRKSLSPSVSMSKLSTKKSKSKKKVRKHLQLGPVGEILKPQEDSR